MKIKTPTLIIIIAVILAAVIVVWISLVLKPSIEKPYSSETPAAEMLTDGTGVRDIESDLQTLETASLGDIDSEVQSIEEKLQSAGL